MKRSIWLDENRSKAPKNIGRKSLTSQSFIETQYSITKILLMHKAYLRSHMDIPLIDRKYYKYTTSNLIADKYSTTI